VTAGPARGGYYDGRSSKRHEVTLELSGSALRVRGTGVDLSVPLADVTIEERVANAPRLLHLPGGALIESTDFEGADALIERAGRRDSVVVRLQGSWRTALGSIVAIIGAGVVFYIWGLPWAADRIADAIPPAWSEALGQEAVKGLKAPLFRPSKLSEEARKAIEQDLAAALKATGQPMPRLEFRSFAAGPNAFALPGNTMVMTDEMVKLAGRTGDPAAAILGVLGHEHGHIRHRHPLRQFVRVTVLSALLAWWIGDFSTVLAAAAPVLLAARYSRDFEREADREAAALLRATGRSVEPLVELFGLMEGRRAAKGDRGKDTPNAERKPSDSLDYLSSHPGTEERIRILRGQGG
jgi:Zn-dependent protease with chaperone function